MQELSKDLLQKLALDLSLEEITKLCQTSKRINSFVCDSSDFWSNKLYKDFGIRSMNPKGVYKVITQNKAFCIQLNKERIYYEDSFLEIIPSFLNDTTNAKISDILVYSFYKTDI